MVIGYNVTVATGSIPSDLLVNILIKAIAYYTTTIAAYISNIIATIVVKVASKTVCIIVITVIIVRALAIKLGVISVGSEIGVIGWSKDTFPWLLSIINSKHVA